MDYKQAIADTLAKASDIKAGELLPLIEIPADTSMGDYAFPCFKLSKQLRKAPQMIAAEISAL